MESHSCLWKIIVILLVVDFGVDCSSIADDINEIKNILKYINRPYREENYYVHHKLMRQMIDQLTENNNDITKTLPTKRLTKVRQVKLTDKPMFGRQQQWDVRFGK